MGNEADVERGLNQAISLLGGLDVLVLNHIIGYYASWMNTTARLLLKVGSV